jgi:hypothetical protein
MFYVEKRDSTTEWVVWKSKTKSGAVRKINGYKRYGSHGKNAVYTILNSEEYEAKYGQMVERVNMMSGEKYMERKDTPGYMSPSSEAYWSM